MTTPGGIPANVQNRDVACAQVALDTWVQAMAERTDQTVVTTEAALVLRGVLAAQFSEVREAGYVEGALAGRVQTAHLVRDALDGEGL